MLYSLEPPHNMLLWGNKENINTFWLKKKAPYQELCYHYCCFEGSRANRTELCQDAGTSQKPVSYTEINYRGQDQDNREKSLCSRFFFIYISAFFYVPLYTKYDMGVCNNACLSGYKCFD